MAPYLLRQRIHRSQQDHLERVTNQEDQPQINADKTLKNLIMFKKLVLSVSICLQRRLRSLRHFLQVVLRLSMANERVKGLFVSAGESVYYLKCKLPEQGYSI